MSGLYEVDVELFFSQSMKKKLNPPCCITDKVDIDRRLMGRV